MIFFLVTVSARFFALLSIRAALVSGFWWVVSFGIICYFLVFREISMHPMAYKGYRFPLTTKLSDYAFDTNVEISPILIPIPMWRRL